MAEQITDNETEDAAVEDDIHAEAMERFDSAVMPAQEERAMALEDRRFVSIAGAQWESTDSWSIEINTVMVEINKTAQGVEKIIGDYRANRMIVDFREVGNDASSETADFLDGLFRADFYNSDGQDSTDNAFEEGVQGGIGAWRLKNVEEDEFDPDNEQQRIALELIVDADQSVFWDPNAKKYDKSDAEWCIVISAMARAAYLKAYGANRATAFPQGLTKPLYDWYTPDVVRVAEYYVVEVKAEKRYILANRATGEERREWAADLSAEQLADLETEGWRLLRARQVKRKRVKKYVLSGCEVLKGPTVIAGTEIPIVPYYGKRWYIDNMERSRGHVRLAKDAQRVYNMQISKLTELAALSPREKPVFTPAQVQGHEDSWARGDVDRLPYQLINPTPDLNGNLVNQGAIDRIQPPQVPPVQAALIQVTGNDITELTASDDGAAMTQSNVSAEAMDLAAQRTDAKSAIYMDNMRKSMKRCGEIWLSMAREVYIEEGRKVETMDANDALGDATLMEGVTDDQGRYSIRNDLSKGSYKVVCDVTEATTTRRDKTVKTLVNVAQIAGAYDPELASASLATALNQMDGEGMEDLKAWNRRRLVQQGIVKPTPEEQQEIEQAAQEPQQPDPQADFLAATAEKARADAQKSLAGVKQTEADTVLKLAQAHKTNEDAKNGGDQHKMGMVERVKGFFQPKPKEPGNAARGGEPPPR